MPPRFSGPAGKPIDAAVSAITDEPISPELALVCPELAARARALLPERDPDAFLPRRVAVVSQRRGVEITVCLPRWAAVLVYVVATAALHLVQGLTVVAALVIIVALLDL